jgi:CubicO group peptidase (beta-lactamase class C family)
VESVGDHLDAVVATGVPGAVALGVGPVGRVEAAAGFADVRTGRALTVDHRFRTGSVTKISWQRLSFNSSGRGCST